MAAPTPAELLTTEELLALQDALSNRLIVSALEKVFTFDEKFHLETMRNAALAQGTFDKAIVVAAAEARYAAEVFTTIRKRVEALTVRR